MKLEFISPRLAGKLDGTEAKKAIFLNSRIRWLYNANEKSIGLSILDAHEGLEHVGAGCRTNEIIQILRESLPF